jgi:Uma2 family endonuclease
MSSIAEKKHISVQEYLDNYPETMQPMELIDGEVIVSPAPIDYHSAVSANVMWILMTYVRVKQLGQVRSAPTDVHLGGHVLQPDVLFIHNDNIACRVEVDGYLHGAPDLCVEIISPSTEQRDRDRKAKIYAEYGVREYWLVEPKTKIIEVYKLEAGVFVLTGSYKEGESFASHALPDLTLNATAFFEV